MSLIAWVFTLAILIILFLYYFWPAFRYMIKFGFLLFVVMMTGALITPFAMMRPWDVRNIRWAARIWNILFQVSGLKSEIRNQEYLISDKPCIILCNHQSSLDLIAMMKYLPDRFTALAKKELIYSPFGVGAWFSGLVYVDRLNREKSRATMDRTAKRLVENNLKLWIFPEGTRNTGGSLLPFKKGGIHLAIQAQVPIVPVVMSSYRHFLNHDLKIFDGGKVIMTVLPPISTQGLAAENVNELTEKVRAQMMDAFEKSSAEVEAKVREQGLDYLLNIVEKKKE